MLKFCLVILTLISLVLLGPQLSYQAAYCQNSNEIYNSKPLVIKEKTPPKIKKAYKKNKKSRPVASKSKSRSKSGTIPKAKSSEKKPLNDKVVEVIDDNKLPVHLDNGIPLNEALSKPSNKDPGFGWVIVSLLFVIGLIIVSGKLYMKLKKINPSMMLSGKFDKIDANKFNILSTTTLGQGRNIHLVEINGKRLVIGSTASNISLLTEIDSADEVKDNKQKEAEISEESTTDDFEQDISNEYPDIYKEYLDKE